MTKKNNGERCRQIIQEYYANKYDEQTGSLISGLFAHWFFSDEDREEKDRILGELFNDDVESDDPQEMMSEERLIRLTESVVEQRKLITIKDKKRKFIRVWASVAAVVAPLLIVGSLWIAGFGGGEADEYVNSYVVMNGEREEVTLPDSTEIHINSDSRIDIRINDGLRSVRISGEAFFKVARENERPFVVRTERFTVTVLGTEFSVDAYPDRETSTVTLVSGLVKVEFEDGREYRITPNHQLIHYKATDEVEIVYIADTSIPTGWIRGVMICDKMGMPDILGAVERHFDTEVNIDGKVRFPDMVYTIRFDSGDTLEEVLAALRELVGGFDYAVGEKTVEITKDK